jgi:hypothetical protein
MHRHDASLWRWMRCSLLIVGIVVSLLPTAAAAAAPKLPVSRPHPSAPCMPYPVGQGERPQILARTAILLVPTITTPLFWPAVALMSATLQPAADRACVLAPDHR